MFRNWTSFGSVLFLAAILVGCGAGTAEAGTWNKANNVSNLNTAVSWVEGSSWPKASADIAQWNNAASAAASASLGADLTWGTLNFTAWNANFTINAGNTLSLQSGITMAAANNLTLNCPVSLQASQAWNVNVNRTLTAAGIISGAGGINLTKAGGGMLTLSAANTFAGQMAINAGTVKLGNTNGIGPAASATVAFGASSNGKLQLNGNNVTIVGLSGDSTATIENGAGAGTSRLTIDSTSDVVFPGLLQDGVAGALTLSKAENNGVTLTLSNTNNSFSGGPVIIYPGVLSVASLNSVSGPNKKAGSCLGAPSSVANGTIDFDGTATPNQATLKYTGPGETTDRVISRLGVNMCAMCINGSGTGGIKFTSDWGGVGGGTPKSIYFSGSTLVTNEFAGAISGYAGCDIDKNGACKWVFSGANNFGGQVNIQAGVLNIRNGSGLGTVGNGTVVSSGAALEIEGGITTSAEDLTLNGTGISNGGALRNVSGNNTFAGLVTNASPSRINSDSGRLTLSNTGTIGGPGNSLTVGGAGDVTIASIIGIGAGTLTEDGNGKLTLTGANTYSGGTIINSGKLLVNNATGSGTGTGPVTVNSGGTLGGTGAVTGTVTVNANGILAPSPDGQHVGTQHYNKLTLTSGSVLDFNFNDVTNSMGVVDAPGGLTINGGGFNFYQEGTTNTMSGVGSFTLFNYSGTLNGSLSNLSVLNPSPGTVYSFTLAPGAVMLFIAKGTVLTIK